MYSVLCFSNCFHGSQVGGLAEPLSLPCGTHPSMVMLELMSGCRYGSYEQMGLGVGVCFGGCGSLRLCVSIRVSVSYVSVRLRVSVRVSVSYVSARLCV